MHMKLHRFVFCCLVMSIACIAMDNNNNKVLGKRKRGRQSQFFSSKIGKLPLITEQDVFNNPIATGQNIAHALQCQDDQFYKQVHYIIAYEGTDYNDVQKVVSISTIVNVLNSYPGQFQQQKNELLTTMREYMLRLPPNVINELNYYLSNNNNQ